MTPLKAALIGPGNWGRVLAKAAAQSGKIDFVSCVGRNPERLAAFSKDLAIPPRDADAVLADDDIGAVVLTLPNEIHYEFAARAARAGKHIYIEKPIANTLEDALAIAALEQAYGVCIVIGHCARLLSGVRVMRKAMDDGTLGKVTQIEANFSNDRGLKLSANDWRWYQASSPGGSLSQIGIHQFDMVRYLGGDIAAVSASAARHSPVGAEVEDQWIVTLHFADGKLGVVMSNWTSPGTYSVRVTGQDAVMFYDIDQTFWPTADRLHENATLYRQPRGKGPADREHLPVPPGDMFRAELELFADAVAGGDCELTTMNGCLAVATVYAAITSAHESSRVVPLDEVIATAQAAVRRRTG
ncbi:MAG TPA: Gfo/Idh/MocA family oxidoreductase [Pseudolabrys sp.]|nr:Gfo/Idh/MocA family oxidoreductase [Pseudolabrys sp.]